MEVTTTVVSAITGIYAESGGVITGDPDHISSYLPLTELLIKDKFRLYNQSRQKITADIRSSEPLKPLQLFEDNKQTNKQFVLGATRWNLTKDLITVELYEYDNTTEINLTTP